MADIEQFDLFFGYVEFDEKNDGKSRPVVYVDLDNLSDLIRALPIYSYRDWMDELNNFFEIIDLDIAGLNGRSFIDIDREQQFLRSELMHIQKLGHLSDRDIDRLIEKLSE